MYKFNPIVAVLFAAAAASRAADPPDISLSVPPPFATDVTIKHFRAGEDLVQQFYHLITVAPLTQYRGSFGPRVADPTNLYGWVVDVFARFSPKVSAACAAAKDGDQADLNVESEFFGMDERSYMFARFEHKHFKWGRAVSFLSQFTQDTAYYVPHNGHLEYEVWGITNDRMYTVVATVRVSHPKLADWGGRVRVASSLAALQRDRDYKRVQRCRPEQFEPSLTAFDRMLNTLVIR